ncbi:MAG: GDP-mannose 4,6-dehydratase [Chloroflexota bacterium]
MRALITGSGGFAGAHLAAHLRAQLGLEVFGVVRFEQPGLADGTYVLDLADADGVTSLLKEVRPDLVFHLAAQAAVHLSWSQPRETLVNNLVSQLSLLEGILAAGLRPRVLVVGSADEYGIVLPGELPIDELNPLRPNSPYAVSKVAQDMLGFQYFLSHKMHVVRVRPFNHIGPGQSDAFATASFAKQIAEIEAGLREPVLLVGNLHPKRDFTDVRDIVRGYALLLERGMPGEVYNLGSGRSVEMGEVLAQLIGLARATVEVREDPARMRPSDNPELICNAGKAKAATGWEASIPLEQTFRDLLNYWRERIGRGGSG